MNRRFMALMLVALAICTCLRLSAFTDAEANYREGMAAVQSNDFPQAIHHLELALTEDPDSLRYGSEYRQTVIREATPSIQARDLISANKDFDHAIDFFSTLLAAHPGSGNLHLNYGLAYVDKIPSAGSITQVVLANTALGEFSKAVELQSSWIAYYTRGASYLFWPKVFNRAPLGVADLEKALEMQQSSPLKPYYVRTYIALGDGYYKTDQLDKARQVWQEGLLHFPGNSQLSQRLSLSGDELVKVIENSFDPNKRVDTDLREVWSTQ